MKLVFPGGEHPQVLLARGVNRVGSDPDATIFLDRAGLLARHCQLHVSAAGVMLDVAADANVSVNDRPVAGLISLRAGDTLGFDQVQARLAAMESVEAADHTGSTAATRRPGSDDPSVTAVRLVLPRYVLRGVSGTVFGRTIALHAATTIGRSQECNLPIDEPGLSRIHARMIPGGDGVQLEDLGSTNGTFINDERVVRGMARVGDEIGFDTVRFRLTASHPADQAGPGQQERTTAKRKRRWLLPALVNLAVLAACVLGYLLLR